MTKLSAKYLIRKNKADKYFLARKKGDTDKQFLNRITHLPLQNQFIEQIMQMKDCENVRILYLQNNLLKNIENMDNFPNLTHLYLQKNFLGKLENFHPLTRLRKIYLGHNEIQVLEGFETHKAIEEIHLESQDVPLGTTLLFEPLTIQNLGETLRLLNISENNLTSLHGLKGLLNLRTLIANFNRLLDINDVVVAICELRFLKSLSLVGNAVTKNRWYRDSIIMASKSLELLDNSLVSENTRLFIEKLTEQKRIHYNKHKTKAEEDTKTPRGKVLKFLDCAASKETYFDFNDCFPIPRSVYLYPAWGVRKYKCKFSKSENPLAKTLLEERRDENLKENFLMDENYSGSNSS